jgi:hypothetical protein
MEKHGQSMEEARRKHGEADNEAAMQRRSTFAGLSAHQHIITASDTGLRKISRDRSRLLDKRSTEVPQLANCGTLRSTLSRSHLQNHLKRMFLLARQLTSVEDLGPVGEMDRLHALLSLLQVDKCTLNSSLYPKTTSRRASSLTAGYQKDKLEAMSRPEFIKPANAKNLIVKGTAG